MFDNNEHKPILSETEIRFLLSDQPVPVNCTPAPARDKAKKTTKGGKRETSVDDFFVPPAEPG